MLDWKAPYLLVIVSFFTIQLQAQSCANSLLISDRNVSSITDPSQLLFVKYPKNNPLNHFVKAMQEARLDKGAMRLLIDSIGALKSPEAYCLLYTCCCRPIVISDLNAFNGLAGSITGFGGYKALNKYYLNSCVDPSLERWEFANQVILECVQNEPKCYYCSPKHTGEKESIPTFGK